MEGGTKPGDPTIQSNDKDVQSEKADVIKTGDLVLEVPAGGAVVEKPDAETPTSGRIVVQTKAQRVRARMQFAVLCWAQYLAGWNDGGVGPLLPRVQKVYNVSFAVIALVFVFACVGYLLGALANMALDPRYGFGKVILLGSVILLVGYSIQLSALPFPAFVLGCTLNGIGMALQDAQANGFVASLKDNAEAKMGILHAAYGAGALSSPLVATQFAQIPRWSFNFLVSLGMQLINTVLLIVVFRLKTQDECLAQIGQSAEVQRDGERSHFRQIFALRDVHLLAMFILIYLGVEATIGSWTVTYLIDVHRGGPSVGYISSAFFGGLMIGRIALLWVNKKVGEWKVLFFYAIISIGLELVVWLVPSLVGDAISISIIGVLLGPMYPIVINHAGRVLPPWLLTGSLGWISSFGQAGSALFPFLNGAIASKTGISSMQPLLVSMMALMTVLWAFVPRKGSRHMD